MALIDRHEANTDWWGADVGIVRDAAFFALPAAERDARLAPFAWAEWRAPLDAEAAHARDVGAAGFWWADVQLGFRLALRGVTAPCEGIATRPLDDATAHRAQPFRAERYLELRGAGEHSLADRYADWAGRLAAADPDWALEVTHEDVPQGWFCATPGDGGLRLTLAALYEDAVIAGPQLYRAALAAYAGMGARVGWAAFSVRNAPVMNVYAALGARFGSPEAVWLWEATP